METNEIVKKLTEHGGKLWEKNDMKRVYFNSLAWGLEISRYNTGNISYATINGERISNSEASRCENVKIWYDLLDGKFYTKNIDNLHSAAREAIKSFIANAL